MEYGFQCRCERCLSAGNLRIDGQLTVVDQQIQAIQFDEAKKFIKQNFTFLATTDESITTSNLDLVEKHPF